MYLRYIHLSLFIAALPLMGAEKQTTSLKDLQWQYRVLLVNAPKPEQGKIKQELEEARAAIEDRHIAWMLFTGQSMISHPEGLKPDTSLSQKVSKRFFTDEDKLKVVLIGKDGGVKARYDELDLDAVFALIDTMPMRRAEMRRQAEPVK